DRQLAVELDAAVAGDADVARAKHHRRRLSRVEELRREQVVLQLRDRGLDGVDLRRPEQNAILEGGVDVLEVTAEGRDAVVLDRKAERAVNGIQLVGVRGDLLNSGGGHVATALLLVRGSAYALARIATEPHPVEP